MSEVVRAANEKPTTMPLSYRKELEDKIEKLQNSHR